jgi:hypothetical protein
MKSRILAVALLALAGCSENHVTNLSPNFGNAVNYNIAVQVDNPLPNERIGAGPQDGTRLENAIERYRTNKVYRPELPLQGGHIYDQPQQQQQ